MKRGIGFGKIGMNLGSLQIREKDAAAEKSVPDEGGGFGKMDKSGGGGFGKMDKPGGGAGKIDNLLESEKGAGEDEYRQGYLIEGVTKISCASLKVVC
jgi:hypothetical protein